MNPFLVSPAERLKKWREFKKSLNDTMSDKEQLTLVIEWWAQCPLSNRSIDPYDSKSWPTGWELIHYGEFCKSAIGLGIEQTLLLRSGRWTPDRIKLMLIDDNGEDIYLVVLVDNKWLLNYEHNLIIDFNDVKNISIIEEFVFEDHKHVNFIDYTYKN